MEKRIMSIFLTVMMAVLVLIPNTNINAAAKFVVGIDENGNEVTNVSTLTSIAEGGYGWSLYVDCEEDEEWSAKITKGSSWISLEDSESSISLTGPVAISVYINENNTDRSRDGAIRFKYNGNYQTIKVTQKAGKIKLTLTSSTSVYASRYGGDGNSITFDATDKTKWKVESNRSWITFDTKSGVGSDSVTPSFKANKNKSNRYATIYVKYYSGGWKVAKKISVTQAGTKSDR